MLPVVFRILAILGAGVILPLATEATLLTINNPSFESPGAPPHEFVGGMTYGPDHWTVYNTGATDGYRYFGGWNPSGTLSYSDPVPDGATMGVVFLLNTTNLAEAGLQQTLASTLQLSTQYTLTVEVGNFSPADGPTPYDFTGFPGYRVDLLAGSTVIGSDNNTLAPAEGRFLTSTVSVSIGSIHADVGRPLTIRLVNLNGPGIEVNFDRVQLNAVAVPEPASAVLLALGAGLAGLRRSRATP